jgi:hypothetical protein
MRSQILRISQKISNSSSSRTQNATRPRRDAMKHYTFSTNTQGLLEVLESASYAIFTTVNADGYVTGYAQGSVIPPKIATIYGKAHSKYMRQSILDLGGGATTETGLYATMGQCLACDKTSSRSWSPWHCGSCFVTLKM